jgi:hypothetical protein
MQQRRRNKFEFCWLGRAEIHWKPNSRTAARNGMHRAVSYPLLIGILLAALASVASQSENTCFILIIQFFRYNFS